MPESIQHKLDRVRRPRVQITYDVETLGSIVKTELPFVVGIMADLSGNSIAGADPNRERKSLKDRKFVEIDRDNFNTIMEKTLPTVTLAARKKDGSPASFGGVSLKFKNLDDFEPINVLKGVEGLRNKFESRIRLSNLLAKLDGNPVLQAALIKEIEGFLKQDDKQAALKQYISQRLHPEPGKAEVTGPDLNALITAINADKKLMRRLKAHIVETYGNTQTPGMKALVDSLADDKKTELKTYIVTEMEPYTPDMTKLVAAVPAADKAALDAKIQEITGSKPGETPDLNSIPDEQKTALKTHIATTYKDAAAAGLDLTALVDSVTGDEKEELKTYIATNLEPSANVSTIKADAKQPLEFLVDALSDADKQKLKAYLLSEEDYQAAVKAVAGGGQ